MTYSAVGAWCDTLVWVLSHSLWQGALSAAVVWLVLHRLPARRANLRYAAAIVGLASVVLASFATWSVLRLEPAPSAPRLDTPPPGAVTSRDGLATSEEATSTAAPSVASSSRAWTIWLAGLWLAGAGALLVRRSVSVLQAQRWVAASARLPGFDVRVLEDLTRELSARLGLRRAVRLVVSEQVRVPAVVGTLTPCVLLPVALVSGVPVEQWRIILAHELAHVRRYDELVNLAQLLIESLLFFNPAVWWLSRQVRREREACCDALAVAVAGAPLSVARTLVDVAASVHEGPAALPALAMAQPGRPGELTDRVQRLVAPERASRPSVSRAGLAGALLGLIVAGTVLQQGTDLAVRAAAELMSPRERVERIARLQAEDNGIFLAPATNPNPAPGQAIPATEESDEKLKVTLVVRTEDGAPVPARLHLTTLSVRDNSSNNTGLSGPGKELPEYRKTFTFPPCRLRLGAHAEGFAVAASPILNLFAGDPERTVELVLKRGARATLKVTDEQDRPIAGAELSISGRVAIAGSGSGHDPRTARADDQGVIVLAHIGAGEYSQELRAAGFQRAERVDVLDVTAPMTWRMTAARPAPVKVVDSASEMPVAGARFELAAWQRPGHRSSSGDPRERKKANWLTYAETDAGGRAVLSELRDGTSYVFGVLAPGYGMAWVEDIEAGQPERVIRLAAPLKLAGRVTGALERLPTSQGERYLNYFTRLNGHVSHTNRASVDAEGRFEINGLSAGERLTVQAAGADVLRNFMVKESRAGLELKVPDPVAARSFPKRAVVIRLVGTAPGAAARGTLWINTSHPDPACPDLYNGPLPISDNEVRLELPIGAQFSFEPRDLAGYVIEPKESVEVTAGEGAQVIDAAARAAGAIHGVVVRSDGSPATSAFVSVFASKLPAREKDHRHLNPSSATGSPTFLLNLPFGGRYRVLARESTEISYVWAVSDEIALDESQPIAKVRLMLAAGKPVQVKVVDPEGRPVANQPVTLELSFSQREPAYSFGTSLQRRTGTDGVARFEDLAVDADIKPLRASFHLNLPPKGYIGVSTALDPHRPLEIRLERGLSAAGVVVEADTGKPVPRAEVRIMPRDFAHARFKDLIRTRTNERGEFRFDGLEDQEYTGFIEGAVPKGTIVTRDGRGTHFAYPDPAPEQKLRAGDQNVRWEVLIYPGSSLKTAE